jgi:hypothetical protein
MVRLNEGGSEERPRFSLLPEETSDDHVVCTPEWLEEATKTPDGLVRAFNLIMATIRERNQAMQERNQELEEKQAQNEAHEIQITELINERDELNQELLQSLRGRTTSPQSLPSKSTKIPNPPLLTDGKSPTFSGWLLKVKNKLKVNADHFADEDAKIAYIQLCTDGEASEHIQPRLEESSADPYQSATDLLEHLQSIYEDPNRVFKAKNEFKKLFMKESDAFHEFYTRFLHLSGKAKIATSDLKYELNNKLSFNLQKQVIVQSHDDNISLKAFADQCGIVDQSLKAIMERQNRNRLTTGRTNTQGSAPAPVSQEGTLAPVTASTASLVPRTTQPRTLMTDKERQKLQDENKCYYCKKEGHRFFECPARARANKLTTVNLVSTGSDKGDKEAGQGKVAP